MNIHRSKKRMNSYLLLTFLLISFSASAQVVFTKTTYPTNGYSNSMVLSDLNGDGHPDLAVGNSHWNNTPDNGIAVFLNNGSGDFGTPTLYLSDSQSDDIHAGDLNGDGHPDLVRVDRFTNKLSVLLSDGNGNFPVVTDYTIGNSPIGVRISDVNNDGNPDVIVVGEGAVWVLLNDGNGDLAAPVSYSVDGGRQLDVGDLSGDGYVDLAVTNGGSNTVSVLLNNGDGTFAAQTTYETGPYAFYVTIGNLNGAHDGNNDLIVTNRNNQTISVLLNTGGGVFAPHVVYPVGDYPTVPAIGDLDGDGRADIVVGNGESGNISILLNKGNGDFSVQSPIATGAGSFSVVIADMDGDGKNDIAVANAESGTLSVLLNAGSYEPTNNILYVNQSVDQDAPGYIGNGSSWDNAIPELADALKWVREQDDGGNGWTETEPLRIFVAKGIYLPLYNAGDGEYTTDGGRDNAFVLMPHVQLYGHFAGTETSLDDRELLLVNNETILSGDLASNDDPNNPEANKNDNAYHVVLIPASADGSVLDGFTVTGGNAVGEASGISVSGIFFVRIYGGGIVNWSSGTVRHTRIVGNRADADNGFGGGILNTGNATYIHVVISGNTASEGGGMYSLSSPKLTHVTISGNAASTGGGIYNDVSSLLPELSNSIVWGNSSGIDGASTTITHSLVQGLTDTGNGNISSAGIPADGSTVFMAPVAFGDAPTIGGDYSLKIGSPAINTGDNQLYWNMLHDGAPATNPAPMPDATDPAWGTDLAGNPRLIGGTVDLGAYEIQLLPQTITADDVSKTYGEEPFVHGSSDSSLPLSYQSDDTDVAVIDNGEIHIVSAGTVTITASQAGDEDYLPAADMTFTLTVTPKELTVVGAQAQDRAYDSTSEVAVSGATLDGVVGNDNVSLVDAVSGTASAVFGTDLTVTTAMSLTGADSDNYTLAQPSLTVSIGSRTLILSGFTADSKEYDGTTGVAGTGFDDDRLGGDDLEFTYTADFVDANAGVSKNVYYTDITISGGAHSDYYELSSAIGTATADIIPATLTVTAEAKSKVYGDADPVLTYTHSGLVSSDGASVFVGELSRTGDENAGIYTINQGTLAAGGNYDISFTGAVFEISKANQQISFTAPSELAVGSGTFALTASSSSGLPVTLSVDDLLVATVSGHDLTPHRIGTVRITATQEGDQNYEPANPVTVTVRVVDGSLTLPIRVHPAVSPNGDGINDFLIIEGIRDYPDNRVMVFDRAGHVFAEIEGYDNQQNVFTGEYVRDGTYLYRLDVTINGKRERLQGFFEVKRN